MGSFGFVCLVVAVLGCSVSFFLVLYFIYGAVMDVVAFAGSRSLSFSFAPLARRVVGAVVASGRSVSVGCCTGSDAIVLSELTPESGSCFAAFGSDGAGSFSSSAVAHVSQFHAAGGSVNWWAGGSEYIPLSVRLANRTKAVINAADTGLVVFFGSPTSKGSLLACRIAFSRGLPVFAFPCGFNGSLLPSLGAGVWVPVGGSGVLSSAYQWQPYQANFFDF